MLLRINVGRVFKVIVIGVGSGFCCKEVCEIIFVVVL